MIASRVNSTTLHPIFGLAILYLICTIEKSLIVRNWNTLKSEQRLSRRKGL